MTWDPAYTRQDEWICHEYRLATGNVLRFAAQEARRENSGIHAKIAISLNWVTLGWSVFNIDRDEDRVRLSNSAYKHLGGEAHELDRAEFPPNIFKHALDLFCEGLWAEVVGEITGGLMEGDPDIAPARRLLGDYILDGAGTIIFAPPGAGKTVTALAMGVSLAWGIDALWPVHDARTPLYINVERSKESMQARLARINRALGLDPRTPLPFLNARGKSLSDVYEAARRTMKQEGCTVAIYDSLSRAGFGSLVKDDVANRTMDMLNALTPTWLALGHSPRDDNTHVYGSQMFDAAPDLMVRLLSQASADKRTLGVGLEVTKANDIPTGGLSIHAFEFDQDGLTGARRARDGEFVEIGAEQKKSREQAAREYLLSVGKATAEDVAKAIGWQRSHTGTMLHGAKWAGQVKEGRRVLFFVKAEEGAPAP